MAVQQDQSIYPTPTSSARDLSHQRPGQALRRSGANAVLSGIARFAAVASATFAFIGGPAAVAQTTSGNAGTGATLWTNGNCTICHGATPTTFYNAPKNAANAGGVILNANTNGMGGQVAGAVAPDATQRADLAAYIATFVPAPSAATVPYNSGAPAPAPTAIAIDHIYLATTYGAFTGLQTVNANGASISYTGTTANYVAAAGACGSTSFTYEGTGAAGQSNTRTQPITITAPSAPVATSNAPAAIAYSTSATNVPLNLSGTAPTSLTILSQPAVGTVATTGSNTISYTASATNYSGSLSFTYRANGPCSTASATATVTLTVNPPPAPAITSSLTATATGGQAFTYTLTASNAPTTFTATGLPTGLTFNPATQVISGTPTQTGTFNVAVSAANGTGTTNGTLVLTVNLVAPVITSALTANATSGAPFTYTITANNLPASFNATGLPTGLSINTTTGVISGTPVVAVGGPVNVTISATNATNTDSRTLVLTVSLNAPSITSANTASGNATQPFTFTVTATDFPTSYAASGLPAGLSINTTTGVISGTPTAPGVSSVTVTATNGSGSSAPQTLTITINLLAPVVTSIGTASGTVSQSFSYQITASNIPASFNATGLPTGLSVNTATGLISGIPAANGTFNVTISATNGTGTGTLPLTITIANLPPPSLGGSTINVPFAGTGTVDLAGLAGGAGPFTFTLNSQPANGTATLAGSVVTYRPNANFFGTDSFTFSVTGAGGTSGPATVSVTVATPGAPTVTGRAVTVPFNGAVAIDLTANVSGVSTSIAISTPPTKGTATLSGRIITYRPNTGYFGTDSFAFTAIGPGGTSMPAQVDITVATQAPVAGAVRFILPLNTPTTMDMGPFITGSAISGVSIVSPPKYGEATVNGTKVTYKPNADYFGDDSFTYAAYGNAGASPPATATVTIVGRPDPTRNANIGGIISAQSETAQRFAQAQISNFQSRMESLHRAKEITDARNPGATKKAERPAPATRPVTEGVAGVSATSDKLRPVSTQDASSPVPLVGSAISLATSGSVGLAGLGAELGVGGGGKASGDNAGLWIAGTANFGTRTANGNRSGADFTTSGVSIGFDKRANELMAVGIGLGFARDRTDVGTDGSNSRAKGYSVVAYGTYQPVSSLFVDALLGVGSLDFTSKRYITPIDAFAQADRKGRQIFGSVAAGFESRTNGVLMSPYGRIDYASNRLNQASETGAGNYGLTYFSQTTPSLQGALGFRAESIHATEFGAAAPRLRAEYIREFQGSRDASVAYADIADTRYGLRASGYARNALVLGVGSDFQFRSGLTLGVDYQVNHTFNRDTSQGLRLTLTQPLDGRRNSLNLNYLPIQWSKAVDVLVDAGFMYDTNVSRGKDEDDIRKDRVYSVNASKGFVFQIGEREDLRASVDAQFSGEKFDTYRGLDRATFGAAADIKYRSSAEFDAFTLAAFTQAMGEYTHSTLRRGYRFTLGVSARQQITDKIGLFAAVSYNQRWARSSVFDNRFGSIRVNADYALSNSDTIYVTGEYRNGHIVSSGNGSLENLDVSEVFVVEDAFPGTQFQAYRFTGNTYISTLGYNMGFGPRHSLDISWRRAQSAPSERPISATGPRSYIADQYSIVYLIRF